MDSEKRGSRLFLGRKLWPYFLKPESEPVVAPEDTLWVFGEQIFGDTTLGASLVIIEDEELFIIEDLFLPDDPTVVGSSAMFTEGLVVLES